MSSDAELDILLESADEWVGSLNSVVLNREHASFGVEAGPEINWTVVRCLSVWQAWAEVSLLIVMQVLVSVEESLVVSSLEGSYYELSAFSELAFFETEDKPTIFSEANSFSLDVEVEKFTVIMMSRSYPHTVLVVLKALGNEKHFATC